VFNTPATWAKGRSLKDQISAAAENGEPFWVRYLPLFFCNKTKICRDSKNN